MIKTSIGVCFIYSMSNNQFEMFFLTEIESTMFLILKCFSYLINCDLFYFP